MQTFTLQQFKYKQILSSNPTEKRVAVLGSIQGQAGQAIMIINAKTPDQQKYKYAQVKEVFRNDIYSRFDVRMEGEYEIQAIYPITDKHKSKYKQKKMRLVRESAQNYRDGQQELLAKQLAHIQWVTNIIEGKAEVDRVLYKNQKFIILPDFKYSNLTQTENLHLLILFTDKDLHSIRDLRGSHLTLLKQIEQTTGKILQQKFNLTQGSCRMFCHYPPTFYKLHIHVTILKSLAANALVQRAHLLQNIMANLEVDGEYYAKSTLFKTMEE